MHLRLKQYRMKMHNLHEKSSCIKAKLPWYILSWKNLIHGKGEIHLRKTFSRFLYSLKGKNINTGQLMRLGLGKMEVIISSKTSAAASMRSGSMQLNHGLRYTVEDLERRYAVRLENLAWKYGLKMENEAILRRNLRGWTHLVKEEVMRRKTFDSTQS